MRRISGPGVVLLVALVSSLMAWWLIAPPVLVVANVAKHPGHFPLVWVHVVAGTLMLFLGIANLYVGTTRRAFRYHRAIGATYLVAGTIAAALAIALALGAQHEAGVAGFTMELARVSDAGYSLAALGLAWLVAASMGWRAARNRRFDSHRAWMIRSYVLTWSFVLCRLVGRVPGADDVGSGAALIWLSWIVPLFACEVALQWRAGGEPAGQSVRR